MEMVQMKYMSGEADFARESATIDNISLYRENEEKSHLKAYTTSSHVNSCSFNVNLNYGMNTDGTVKDDDLSKAWQECVSDARFLKALQLCIDAQEILDTVYNGFGVINDKYECTGDFDAANALLDEMGMVDVDGDGWRETPSGLPFSFMLWNSAEASDFTPNSEFWVEYTSQIGLKFGVNPSDQQNLRNAWAANEVPCSVFWCESAGLWYTKDWDYGAWAPLWGNWYSKGGLSGEESEYAVPSDTAIKFFENVDKLLQVDPAVAATELFDEQGTLVAEMGGNILPIASIDQCVLVNEDIGNVPTGGIGIGWNCSHHRADVLQRSRSALSAENAAGKQVFPAVSFYPSPSLPLWGRWLSNAKSDEVVPSRLFSKIRYAYGQGGDFMANESKKQPPARVGTDGCLRFQIFLPISFTISSTSICPSARYSIMGGWFCALGRFSQ